jgi:hypothetical protein
MVISFYGYVVFEDIINDKDVGQLTENKYITAVFTYSMLAFSSDEML